ncbi:molybdopterin-dependent oxidoreductase, partial [bacterium]|nr:molybdopterin-dependent oxidoreductase [bacterium]
QDLACPDVISTATYRELEDAQAIVVAGSDTCDEHFVADLLVKKAIRKGARLIYVGPESNRTSRHADVFLRCEDGAQTRAVLALLRAYGDSVPDAFDDREALAALARDAGTADLDPDALAAAVAILARSILKVFVCNRDYRGPRVAGDLRLYADAAEALGCTLLALHEKANMQGLLDLGASPEWFPGYAPAGDEAVVAEFEKEWCVALRGNAGAGADLAAKLRDKKIKVAIVIGEDPVGAPGFPLELSEGLCAADFLVVMDLFLTPTARLANAVLPLSAMAETSGTLTNSERRVQAVRRAVPPATALETWQVLCQLGAQMGYRFKMKYNNPAEVFAEIQRVVPAYGNVKVDSADADGVWTPPMGALARQPYAGGAAATTPVPTLALDHLELQFGQWFAGMMDGARARLEAEKAASAV